jgi:hypothetical protein
MSEDIRITHRPLPLPPPPMDYCSLGLYRVGRSTWKGYELGSKLKNCSNIGNRHIVMQRLLYTRNYTCENPAVEGAAYFPWGCAHLSSNCLEDIGPFLYLELWFVLDQQSTTDGLKGNRGKPLLYVVRGKRKESEFKYGRVNFIYICLFACFLILAPVNLYVFMCVCLVLHNFITCRDLCIHHHNQNGEKFHSHQDPSECPGFTFLNTCNHYSVLCL